MGLFGKLLTILFGKPKNPEEDYTITITDKYVQVEHPEKETEEILWTDIKQIKMINTNDGPFVPDIWLALQGETSGCLIPEGAKGFETVYDIISEYENFDFKNYVESMTCTDNQEFLLWEKK
jgi:hypothetical protein